MKVTSSKSIRANCTHCSSIYVSSINSRNAYGVPQGKKSFLEVSGALADLLALAGPELQEFFTSNSEDAIRLFRLLLNWMYKRPSIEVFEGVSELLELNTVVGLANLKAFLKEWKANRDVSKEEFWQTLFAKNAFVLLAAFCLPGDPHQGQGLPWRKGPDEYRRSRLLIFCAKLESTGAAAMVEIKTPMTPLLGSELSGRFIPISNDLAGAISQALKYRSSLMENIQNLQRGEHTPL